MAFRIYIVVFYVILGIKCFGQQFDGYTRLSNFTSASLTALSGSNGSGYSSDANAWTLNPASLNQITKRQISLNSLFHPAEISEFSLGTVWSLDSIWPIGISLQRTSFGKTSRYDSEGSFLGQFSAANHSVTIGTGRKLFDELDIGFMLSYIGRNIDSYRSHIITVGLGVDYTLDDQTSLGLSFHHLGYELKPFASERTDLSADLSLYISRQLEYLPLQMFLKFQKINQWNKLDYSNPFIEKTIEFSDREVEVSSRLTELVNEIFAHVVIGGEFAFGRQKNLWLRFSYDHLRNKQLGIDNIRSLEGIGLGFGLQLRKVKLDYAWQKLYYNASAHQISLEFNWLNPNHKILPKGL